MGSEVDGLARASIHLKIALGQFMAIPFKHLRGVCP